MGNESGWGNSIYVLIEGENHQFSLLYKVQAKSFIIQGKDINHIVYWYED